jgi:hypothetical protein
MNSHAAPFIEAIPSQRKLGEEVPSAIESILFYVHKEPGIKTRVRSAPHFAPATKPTEKTAEFRGHCSSSSRSLDFEQRNKGAVLRHPARLRFFSNDIDSVAEREVSQFSP